MFFNLYKYNIKILLRDKMTVFWLIFYPIILATIYYFSIGNILDGEKFEKIDIAIVENQDMPEDLLSSINNSNMFNTAKLSLDESKNRLSKGQISAYINYKDEIELIVNSNGINESIAKVYFDTYSQISSSLENIIKRNPDVLQTDFLSNIDIQKSNIKNIPVGNSTDVTVIIYYAMIAMICLNGATLGSNAVASIQANQSNIASRINMAPTHKMKSFLSIMASSISFQMFSVIISLFYINIVLGVDFGTNIAFVILICFIGSLMGISLGSLIGAVFKKSQGFKTAVILTINLFGCFLAGMMSPAIKYLVHSNAPIVSYINHANLITDGLYSLYYYDNLERYFINLLILAIYCIVFSVFTYLVIRRQKYASL